MSSNLMAAVAVRLPLRVWCYEQLAFFNGILDYCISCKLFKYF